MTKDGATIVGRLLNQDAFSIQLMNADEQLKSSLESNLREHTIVTKGLMPSYEGKLTSEEIADVVNYLASLPEGEELDAAPNPTPALDRVLHAEREPQNWLTYGGGYSSQRYSLLDQIKPENVGRPDAEVGVASQVSRQDGDDAARRGRRALRRPEQRGRGARRGDGADILDLPIPRAAQSNAYLMVVKGLAMSGNRLFWATFRRAPDCDRREDRQVDLEQDARRLEEGPSVQCRPARRQGQSHPGAGDERIRRQLLDRCVRRAHRKAGLEIQHRRGARRARQRHMAGRPWAARRFADLGDGLLRSGNEPDVLGHRQSESRLDRRSAKPGRQSLLPTRSSRSTSTQGS